MLDYFPGYPARGGTYCMAVANQYKDKNGWPFSPVQAPEMVPSYYRGLKNLFQKTQLAQYVNLTNSKIDAANVQELCPSGLHLWSVTRVLIDLIHRRP
jgi:hypothetical protein